jgi:CO/xanthine dehydrogenase Mo-binding subunit
MRAPGERPSMFGLEVAMDEIAIACGLDPIEFRVRNEPEVDPESGLPFSKEASPRTAELVAGLVGDVAVG